MFFVIHLIHTLQVSIAFPKTEAMNTEKIQQRKVQFSKGSF